MHEGTLAVPDGDGEWLFRECDGVLWRLSRVAGDRVRGGWIAPGAEGLPLGMLKGEWRRPLADEKEVAQANRMGQVLQWVLWRNYSFCREYGKTPRMISGRDGDIQFEWYDEVRRFDEPDGVRPENRLPSFIFDLISRGRNGGCWVFRTEPEAVTVADSSAFQAICGGQFKPRGYV